MADMERRLEAQTVEGEIGLVIDYEPGKVLAVDMLQSAMSMIEALDKLDAALLSSVNTSLEPVSVLNDVQHSSLKMLLARALRNTPDELIGSLDWKKWAGGILVKGKYKLLQRLDADAPEVRQILVELEADYKAAPVGLIGYTPPNVVDVMDAMDGVVGARAALPGQRVTIQTELGDVLIPDTTVEVTPSVEQGPQQAVTNSGIEFFKIKSPDMLGTAQWQVLRNGRTVRVDMLHQTWLDAYHAREYSILPGDSLKCRYEETVTYDASGNELERRLAIIEVIEVISPPVQRNLIE
ncbi:MAG TPA: hypothetical protein VJ654_14225 [Noviherbaspirillum sp.]|nr:hypothetical protein [Noviherbaspirillum sp.]